MCHRTNNLCKNSLMSLVLHVVGILMLHFEVVHHASIANLDADRLPHNPSPSDENLTSARWHENCNEEAVPSRHAATYFTLFSGSVVEVLICGSDDEVGRPQAIVDI